MKHLFCVSVFCLLFCFLAKAQGSYSIKGSVADSVAKKSLYRAEILVLNSKDSILVAFTRAKTDGSFVVNDLQPGQYILLTGYMDYNDYTEHFTLDDKQPSHNFGVLQMTPVSRLLNDVIIKGKPVAIKIKGDTTEFNAGAYVIQPNDKVEDLLKRFPGIRVDRNGKITAQGEKVDKVLLDGEEFFSDDPTLLTRNIRADMVDKVQLYGKQSDKAAFTGIKDDKTTKTLNIKLKKDKKSGSFGKAGAGYGSSKNYAAQFNYNKFNDKEKIALYGIGSNTGANGFSDEDDDYDKLEGLEYDNRGIPGLLAGGAHYSNKWDTDKYAVNVEYKIGRLNVDGTQNTITQNNLPGRTINSNSEEDSRNAVFRQRVDAVLKMAFDTTSNLKITLGGAIRNEDARNTNTDTSRRADNTLLNVTDVSNYRHQDIHRFTGTAFYTKKLNKQRRTFSILFSGINNETKGSGFLKSKLDYYDMAGLPGSEEITDQQKLTGNKHTELNANFAYTEPVTKAITLEFDYHLKTDNTGTDQRAYAPGAGGVYNVLVDSLTSNFKLNQLVNGVDVNINYSKGKLTGSFSNNFANTLFNQIDITNGSRANRRFFYWSPRINLTYKFTPRKFLLFAYGGKAILPALNQIQPVKDNNNPLFVTLGNPALVPSYQNTLGAIYNAWQMVGSQSFFINARYSITSNPIVANISTDSIGKTTVQYANLSGRSPYTYSLHVEYSRDLPGTDVRVGLSGGLDGNIGYNMIKNAVVNTTALNTTKNRTYDADFFIMKSIQDKLDVSVSLGPQYTINKSSLQTDYNGSSSGFKSDGNFKTYLPYGFELGSDISYLYTAKTEALPAFSRTLWNAALSKTFLKTKALKITGAVNDILNQNNGFIRNATGGIISEQRYSTIKRYFMLSISYDFTTMNKASKD